MLLNDIRRLGKLIGLLASTTFVACSQFPTSGPSSQQIEAGTDAPGSAFVQIIELDDRVARQLLDQRRPKLFSESLGSARAKPAAIGRGDALEVSIWEAPPATLFGGGPVDPRLPSSVRATTMPEQVVGDDGAISVPFAGRIAVEGQSLQQVEAEVLRRLRGKANQPEVLVRFLRHNSSTVTVVGEVANSLRMPLTPGGERVLDALAAAGGVRQPVNKVTLQVTRANDFYALPLDLVIRDPRQNVPLRPGDVVTALFQPLSFTALGATGKNEEVSFEAQGISLAQALARVGGLVDTRASPQGVFIFRFEPQSALAWPRQPVATTPEGLVPVVYRIDLSKPSSFFVMQSFPISNKDVLYVTNAPAAELQKFLNVVFSITYPLLTAVQATK